MNFKCVTTTLVLLLLSNFAFGQASLQDLEYLTFSYGTVENDFGDGIVVDSEGNIFIAGSTEGSWNGSIIEASTNAVVIKISPKGELLKSYQFGQHADYAYGLALDESTDSLYIVGVTNSDLYATANGDDGYVAVTDLNLNSKWGVQFSGDSNSQLEAVSLTSDGFLIVGGYSADNYTQYNATNPSSDESPWIVKMDAMDGTILWMKYIEYEGELYDLGVDSVNNVYAVGLIYVAGNVDMFIVKYTTDGIPEWIKTFGSTNVDIFTGVTFAEETGIVYAAGYGSTMYPGGQSGVVNPQPTPIFNLVVAALDESDGSLVWISSVQGDSDVRVFGFSYEPDDSVLYLSAWTNGDFGGNFISITKDVLLISMDLEGNVTESRFLFSNTQPQVTDVADCKQLLITENKDIFIAGRMTPNQLYDFYFTKVAFPSSDDKSKNNIGLIVGVVIAGAVILSAAIGAAVYVGRFRKQPPSQQQHSSKQNEDNITSANVEMKAKKESALSTSTNTTLYSSPHFSMIGANSSDGNVKSDVQTPNTSRESNTHTGGNSSNSTNTGSGYQNITAPMAVPSNWSIPYDEIQIIKKVGAGAFGAVFKGSWRGVEVAVKRILADEEDVEKLTLQIQDFFAEADIMKNLRPHSNVTQLLGVCQSPLCLVTEFVSNGDLHSFLESSANITKELKVQIAKGIAAGMLHLHSEGVIHRDLAARNILLDASLRPKVSDFGMSRVVLNNKTNKTKSEVGPIRWMAPEALVQSVYNTKTDIWSFGVVLYEIISRKDPYYETDTIQVATLVALNKVSLLDEVEKEPAEEVPVTLNSLMKASLRFEPKERLEFSDMVKYFESIF